MKLIHKKEDVVVYEPASMNRGLGLMSHLKDNVNANMLIRVSFDSVSVVNAWI